MFLRGANSQLLELQMRSQLSGGEVMSCNQPIFHTRLAADFSVAPKQRDFSSLFSTGSPVLAEADDQSSQATSLFEELTSSAAVLQPLLRGNSLDKGHFPPPITTHSAHHRRTKTMERRCFSAPEPISSLASTPNASNIMSNGSSNLSQSPLTTKTLHRERSPNGSLKICLRVGEGEYSPLSPAPAPKMRKEIPRNYSMNCLVSQAEKSSLGSPSSLDKGVSPPYAGYSVQQALTAMRRKSFTSPRLPVVEE